MTKTAPIETLPSGTHPRADAESPEFAFDPTDPWTQTFQRGLKRAGLRDKRVYEVGVGTGTNAAFMLSVCGAATVAGSDLDPRMATLAARNVEHLAPRHADRFSPVTGAVSLIDTPEARAAIEQADVVIGCLPQVGDPNDARLNAFRRANRAKLADGAEERDEDHIAHYYPWTDFDDYPFNAVGLGLNEALLQRLRACAPDAEIVLNFGARIGTRVLMELFEANGYVPEKLHSQIVLQHAGTDISFFVALERALTGTSMTSEFTCEFYADPDGKIALSATEAQALVDQNSATEIYHEVCVIKGI